MPGSSGDSWSEWLREQRFSGGEREERVTRELREYRDVVLDHARIEEDDMVLDVGAGDGFIAFGALERLGPDGRVILSDVSDALLDDARSITAELGAERRCEFVDAPAQDLAPIEDESVDVVTLRSVLIYVREKERAFSEFERVLKPGGRLSIFEPIHDVARSMESPSTAFMGFLIDRADIDVDSQPDLVRRIRKYQSEHVPDDGDPAHGFDGGDLFGYAEAAGFEDVYLELSAWKTILEETEDWDAFLDVAYRPEVPTVREAMEAVLSAAERTRLEENLRPLLESGAPRDGRGAIAYLWATKPSEQ